MSSKRGYISVKFSESKLRARNKELSFLLEMSNFLSSSMNLKDLLTGALSKVLEYFNLDAGRIYLMDDGCRHLSLVAHHGIDTKGFEKLHISEGFSGKSARTQSFIAQHISELEDKNRAALLLSKGFKIIICVPLISINKVGGVMNLASRKIISLDQEKIEGECPRPDRCAFSKTRITMPSLRFASSFIPLFYFLRIRPPFTLCKGF